MRANLRNLIKKLFPNSNSPKLEIVRTVSLSSGIKTHIVRSKDGADRIETNLQSQIKFINLKKRFNSWGEKKRFLSN